MLDKESILSVTLNSILDGVLVTDMNGKILCSNSIFARMWGVDESTVQHLDLKQLIDLMQSKVSEPENIKARLENISIIPESIIDEMLLNDGRIIQIHSSLLDYDGQKAMVWNFRDVTEHKQAEEKLKVFENTVEVSTDAIGMSTASGKHYYQNKAFDELFGDIGNDPPSSLFADESVGREVFSTIMAGKEWIGEVKMHAADGRVLDILLRAYSIKDSAGKVTNLVGLITDITEKKRAEGKLKTFESAVEVSTDAIGMSTASGKHYYQNKAFDEIFGDIGSDPPISLYYDESIGREVFNTIMEGKQWIDEVQMNAADGRVIDVLLRAYSIKDDNGKVTNLVGVHTDITDRKLSEKEIKRTRNYLSNIIDSMPSVLIGVDLNCWVTQWNAQAESHTGIAAYKAIGQPLEKLIPYIESDKILAAIQSKLQQVINKQPRDENGEKKYENITIFPLIADGIDGAVIRIDDVTEQVRMEENIIQNEKMLSLGGLAAGMAHEINNPLGGIIQNANVIHNRLTDPDMPANIAAAQEVGITMGQISSFIQARKIAQGIERILASGKRASEIVDSMLAFSRKENGFRSAQNIDEIIDKCLELLTLDYDIKKSYDFKQINILREYQEYLPVVVCEAGKIQQVIINILKNSAEAMQEERIDDPCIILRLINCEDKNKIRIEIENNGLPLTEEMEKRIFEPFFTTKKASQGSGLGLSVSYFIITEVHGGDIWVEPSRDKGANFIIELPLSNE